MESMILNLIEQLHANSAALDDQLYQQVIQFVNDNKSHLTDRKNMGGHLSASGLVFQSDRLWFIKHPYLKTILLPAGHMEDGETPLQTAQREVKEETGFSTRPLDDQLHGLVGLRFIHIPENPIKDEGAHVHLDFRYKLQMADQPQTNSELPKFLLSKQEAPAEFKRYFDR